MASSLIKIWAVENFQPGKSLIAHWNNATPSQAVWYIQAIPRESSFASDSPVEQSVQVEVTRVWRKLNRHAAGVPEFPEYVRYEHEIWFEIKNVGAKEVDIDVYASTIA